MGFCGASMNLKIISWNDRGLNDCEKRLRIQNMIRGWGADIICLQETKMELLTRREIRSLWGCQHLDWLYLGSIGASRGVLVMWDRRMVEKIEWEGFLSLANLRMWWIILFGLSLVYMDQTLIVTGNCFGKSWLVFIVGGM